MYLVFRNVPSIAGIESLRSDLATLCKWSEDWLMLFNYDKCKVMHFGSNNLMFDYTMGGNILQVVDSERDLVVVIQNNLKVSEQCANSVKTGNKIVGMIKRTFSFV